MKNQKRLDIEVLGSYLRFCKVQNSSQGFSPNGVWPRRKGEQKVDLFILENDSFCHGLAEQIGLALEERHPAIDDLASVRVGKTAMAFVSSLLIGRIGLGGSENNSAEQRQKARENGELHHFDYWI